MRLGLTKPMTLKTPSSARPTELNNPIASEIDANNHVRTKLPIRHKSAPSA